MTESASFGALHPGIAFAVSSTLTGSVFVVGGITRVEPPINSVAGFCFGRSRERRHAATARAARVLQPRETPS